MQNAVDSRCTLLVSSCDRYADLWRPYFAVLRMRWPDCPFPVALITEELDLQLPAVQALRLGAGHDWSTLMIRALDQVGTPYVLLTLEDFFLRRATDNARIVRLLDEMNRRDLRMLRLIPRPAPSQRRGGTREYGLFEAGEPYRVSTQAAFWRVDTLRALLVEGESAWQFEVNGSKRSGGLDGFVGVWDAALPYRHHVVERGKWFPWDACQFDRLEVGVDLNARQTMNAAETARWLIAKTTARFVLRVPSPMLRAIKPLARRFGLMK